jgi:phage baseplate assembly protein W
MNATTGAELDGKAHVQQSIRNILTTRIGTRVMRRDYGSRLPQLLDAPLNNANLVEFYAATAEALATWEPRVKVTDISATIAADGRVILNLYGSYLPDGSELVMEGLIL